MSFDGATINMVVSGAMNAMAFYEQVFDAVLLSAAKGPAFSCHAKILRCAQEGVWAGTGFFYGGCRTKRIFCIWLFNEKDFASSDATKGLSGRPLETFGCYPYEYLYSYAANATAPPLPCQCQG